MTGNTKANDAKDDTSRPSCSSAFAEASADRRSFRGGWSCLRGFSSLAVALLLIACRRETPEAVARSTGERAMTRAYDGAPPAIPHDPSLGACTTCHDDDGAVIDGVGVAPASPHDAAAASGAMQRCRQCHVPTEAREVFVRSHFTGLPQGPWKGNRATPGAPPTIPHTLQLRENCLACHAGPAARVELRTSHPERIRCRQCHVPD